MCLVNTSLWLGTKTTMFFLTKIAFGLFENFRKVFNISSRFFKVHNFDLS